MKTNEETFYENVEEKQVTANVLNEEKQETASDRDNMMKRAVMLGGAILAGGSLGGGIAYATAQSVSEPESEEVFKIIDEDDEKSFQQAFSDAREQLGPGAVFRWHGGVYSTYTKEEWESMTAEERAAFNDKVNPILSESDRDPAHYRAAATHHEPERVTTDNKDIVENTQETPSEESTEKEPQPTPSAPRDEYTVLEEAETEIEGQRVIVARAEHNGQPAVLIDIDRDGRYDAAIEDTNNDGELTREDYHDISANNIRVHDPNLIAAANSGEGNDEPVVEINAAAEEVREGVVMTTGTVDGKNAVIVDVNRDGTYDVAYVDQNENNALDDDEMNPVNIVSSNVHVHNTALVDTELTDNGLNGQGDNTPDYMNTVAVNNNENTETEVTVEVNADNAEAYMANTDSDGLTDSTTDNAATLQYDDTAFNDPAVSDTMTDITDDYVAS